MTFLLLFIRTKRVTARAVHTCAQQRGRERGQHIKFRIQSVPGPNQRRGRCRLRAPGGLPPPSGSCRHRLKKAAGGGVQTCAPAAKSGARNVHRLSLVLVQPMEFGPGRQDGTSNPVSCAFPSAWSFRLHSFTHNTQETP